MTKPNLTVIEGGLSSPRQSETKYFISAYVTDTRLMGVLALYIHWRLPDHFSMPDFHQFFYFDSEEYGFETYKSILGNNVEEISAVDNALTGGLGGRKIEVTEREARAVFLSYCRFNEDHSIPLPPGRQEYEFLLEEIEPLTGEEEAVLLEKECGEIASDYQAINYFLMRCFGHDYMGASYLTRGEFPIDIYNQYPCATLCKNTIDPEDDLPGVYTCESLIECQNTYFLLVSQVAVEDKRITGFQYCSGFSISPAEAAMILARPEFITVYELLMPADEFCEHLQELIFSTMMTPHENGTLFLAFNKNNSHVDKRVFRLSSDVFGLYYITDFGQLIMSAYSISNIHAMEKDLRKSVLAPYLIATAKYEFKEPILYEFVQSDFDDFNDFLDFIRKD